MVTHSLKRINCSRYKENVHSYFALLNPINLLFTPVSSSKLPLSISVNSICQGRILEKKLAK